MTKLRLGILLDGAKPVGEGINGALRGFAIIDGEEISVIAKKLPDREVLCEIICAKLGLLLALPIPEPLLLFDSSKNYFFGSVDVGYPNLFHYLDMSEDRSSILNHLKKWVHLRQSSFFDELIFNADRHPGNMLFDGVNFTLIDHGLALHDRFPDDFVWENKLFSVALDECLNDSDMCKFQNDAKKWQEHLYEIDIINSIMADIDLLKSKHKDSLINILIKRQKMILSLINKRISPQQMDCVNV